MVWVNTATNTAAVPHASITKMSRRNAASSSNAPNPL